MSIVMQFWLTSPARADCIASVFSDLLKRADLVVVADIDSVSKDQTSVKIREIISMRPSRSYPSVSPGSLIAIASDSDDSCGVRWTPPNAGQAGIFFLRWISKPKYVGEKRGWTIVGANREGEMPLNGETVFVARELARNPEPLALFGGTFMGTSMNTSKMVAAIKAKRTPSSLIRSRSQARRR